MRLCVFFMALLFMAMPSTSSCKIYKWVDENGTVHFTDKPYSSDAKEIKVKGTGISVHQDSRPSTDESPLPVKPGARTLKTSPASTKPEVTRKITEKDYKISASVGELGGDAVEINGRISAGPRCDNMVVTATATSDTGLSATITDLISKSTSYGSAIFSGTAKATGSSEDYGFWKISSVKIVCNDQD